MVLTIFAFLHLHLSFTFAFYPYDEGMGEGAGEILSPNFGLGAGDSDQFGSSPICCPGSQSQLQRDIVPSRPPVVVPPIDRHSATLIFFHGMGDQGDGWAENFRSNFRPFLRYFKFVAPNAEEIGGMTAWFDYQGLDPSGPEDLKGLEAVKNYAHQLVDREISNGIPASRIFLGGFSQGAPVALYSGLSYVEPLGGVLCLSGFLLPRDTLRSPIRQIPWLNMANSELPIFMGHGIEDPNVPYSVATMTANALRRFDPNVILRTYPMGHSSCAAETNDVIQFIRNRVPDY